MSLQGNTSDYNFSYRMFFVLIIFWIVFDISLHSLCATIYLVVNVFTFCSKIIFMIEIDILQTHYWDISLKNDIVFHACLEIVPRYIFFKSFHFITQLIHKYTVHFNSKVFLWKVSASARPNTWVYLNYYLLLKVIFSEILHK